VVYLKPKQLIIEDIARRFVLKLYRHEASRGLFATAELLVISKFQTVNTVIFVPKTNSVFQLNQKTLV